MTPHMPLCCQPAAFRLMARQAPTLETGESLLQGAIALSMHQLDSVDTAEVEARLQGYADAVRARVRGHQPQALLAHLHEVLFEEEGFQGNTEDYDATANSYLPVVLETKRGLPITLSLIYQNVAVRLGLACWGVGLPGHFLVAVKIDGHPMLVDPFHGGTIVSTEDAHQRLSEHFGSEIEWSDELIRPVSHRQWLTRMLQNLLNRFGAEGHFPDVAAMLELEMLLWPDEARLQRDLGLVLARCGLTKQAGVWLGRYLKQNPQDPQNADLQQLLEVLRT